MRKIKLPHLGEGALLPVLLILLPLMLIAKATRWVLGLFFRWED